MELWFLLHFFKNSFSLFFSPKQSIVFSVEGMSGRLLTARVGGLRNPPFYRKLSIFEIRKVSDCYLQETNGGELPQERTMRCAVCPPRRRSSNPVPSKNQNRKTRKLLCHRSNPAQKAVLVNKTQRETSMVLNRRKMRRPKGKLYWEKVCKFLCFFSTVWVFQGVLLFLYEMKQTSFWEQVYG